jgi:hypothetical protein
VAALSIFVTIFLGYFGCLLKTAVISLTIDETLNAVHACTTQTIETKTMK